MCSAFLNSWITVWRLPYIECCAFVCGVSMRVCMFFTCAPAGVSGIFNTAGVTGAMPVKGLANLKPLSSNKAPPPELSAGRLSGFDVLTSKCLTFLITWVLWPRHCEGLFFFPTQPPSPRTNEKLFNLGFFQPRVKFNQCSAIVPCGNGWTVCLISLVTVRTKLFFVQIHY